MKHPYVAILIVFLVALVSCSGDHSIKTMDIGKFTMDVPSAWSLREVQGYDSFVRQIKIDEQESIDIDLGWYSSSLNVDNSTHITVIKKIDERTAKIVEPKIFKHGLTGVYFDSLDIEKTKLQISGNDLSEKNQRLFLAAIETIKFK